MKIIYSLKKQEMLIQNGEYWEDFAENLWNPNDKFFKAIFHPLMVIDSNKKKKGKKNAPNRKRN